jgi:sec-independent protein translocase protein TatA
MGLFTHWYVLLLVLAVVLIVYGPGKLPEVGGAIGKAMREFRKASTDLQEEIQRSATPSTTTTPSPTATPSPTDQANRPASDTKPTTETKA